MAWGTAVRRKKSLGLRGDSRGRTYNWWGVFVGDGRIDAQYRTELENIWQYPTTLIDTVETGGWYVLRLFADDDEGFTAEIYQKDDPSVRGSYRFDGMPAGKSWRFHHWAQKRSKLPGQLPGNLPHPFLL